MSRPPTPIRRDGGSARRAAGIAIAVVIILLAGLGLPVFLLQDLLVDRLWFQSVGQLPVWELRTFGRIAVFLPVTLVVFLVLAASIGIALRGLPSAIPRLRPDRQRTRTVQGPFGPVEQVDLDATLREIADTLDHATRDLSARRIAAILLAIAALVAIATGLSVSARWEELLVWQQQAAAWTPGLATPAGPGAGASLNGYADPVFGLPLTTWLFDLPVWHRMAGWVGGVLDALIVLTGLAWLIRARRTLSLPPGRLWSWHLGILVALRVAIGAIGFQLDKLSLAFQQRDYPLPTGVGATDAAVRIPAADLMSILTLVAAVVILAAIVRHRFGWAAGAFGAWVAVAIGAVLVAQLNQALFVNPNQLDQERRWLANDIAATRTAYGVDGWETRAYPASTTLTADALTAESETFANARLWDYRPLGATLDQLQTVRNYYDFTDVDIDRYAIGGDRRQVMLSAREMALDRNPAVDNWLNRHFVYTHGYGIAMVPVNAVQPDGLPDLIIRDLPVVSEPGAPAVAEPRIYFGERQSPWVIVGARTDEFDYPANGETGRDPTTRWTGTTGIHVGGGFNRLLFGLWTGDLVSFLSSPQIGPDSQILLRRTVTERLDALAPFLAWDRDPYLVVSPDGRLVWVVDGYTATDSFPLSRSFPSLAASGIRNLPDARGSYLRNAVKAVIDAYVGTTHLYVNDPNDPLVATWAAVYPTLFSPLAELPDGLDAHLRYPEGLFDVQTGIYEAYHVTDPTTFYQGDNLWTVPNGGQTQGQVLPGEAYYVQMRLPDEAATEYLLMQPMVPAKRPNMIAWIAARNDGPDRGDVRVYQLPSDTTIFGPTQIEARIDQTPEISSQITLWDQAGSNVIRGNLIVVPVGGSFVYLEPVYLQSTASAFPQFTKIIVATPSRVVWADTLSEALRLAVADGGAQPGPTPRPEPTPEPGATPAPGATARPVATTPPGTEPLPDTVEALIAYANGHFDRAQEAMGGGDYVTYGQEMAMVRAALHRLAELTGPSPAP
jgi:hypothetical protein